MDIIDDELFVWRFLKSMFYLLLLLIEYVYKNKCLTQSFIHTTLISLIFLYQ